MKIHLVSLYQSVYDTMVELHRLAQPQLHTLVDDPEVADMILFVGHSSFHGHGIVDNPLPRKYPEKTFIYSDDDIFTPLLPGVYASAERPRFFKLNRLESQKFVDWPNPNIRPKEAEKEYLFSFTGRSSSLLRKKLFKIKFKRPDICIENTAHYFHWGDRPDREESQKRFARIIAESHFVLCPKGASAGSYRLFEVMEMGVAPVVISNRLMMPRGPDWDSFAIRVPERSMAKLETILEKDVDKSADRGRLAREAYEKWFSSPVVFNHIVELCERIRVNRRIPERWVQPFWGFMLWKLRCVRGTRDASKAVALWIVRRMGKPYELDTN